MNDTHGEFNQANVTSHSVLDDFLLFSSQVAQDPINTLLNSPVFVIATTLVISLPIILKRLFPAAKKVIIYIDTDQYKYAFHIDR
jgi:hypothetical protein